MKKAVTSCMFQRGNGTYYFRRSVPQDIRLIVGKREWKHSLKTRDRQEAIKLVADLFTQTDEEITRLRGHLSQPSQPSASSINSVDRLRAQIQRDARNYADRAISRLGMNTSSPERADQSFVQYRNTSSVLQSLSPLGVEARERLQDVIRRVEAQENVSVDLTEEEMRLLATELLDTHRRSNAEILKRFGDGDISSPVRLQAVTLATLLKEYRKARAPEWTKKSVIKFETVSRVLIELIGGSTALQAIDRQMLREAHETICNLPPNYAKRREFRRKSIRQISKLASDNGMTPIARKTAGDYLNHMKSFFRFAEAEGLIDKDPAKGLSNISKEATDEKRSFNDEELDLLFSAPVYTGCLDDVRRWREPGPLLAKRSKFWVPLIALHSGMRIGEICGLRCGDVRESSSAIWTMRLAGHRLRQLKTKNSAREVPVHKSLIDLGFIDWAQRQAAQKNENDLLFDDLFPSSATGSLSDPFSKWFTKFRRSVGVSDPSTTFHSFRHYFEDRLREANVSLELNERLMGWSSERMQARYGSGPSLERINQAIQSVQIEIPAIEELKQRRRN